jgi:2-iminobutanoate/2-iminopropanoate deaminase
MSARLRRVAQGGTIRGAAGWTSRTSPPPHDRDMADTRSWTPATAAAGSPRPAGNYSPAIIAGELVFVSGQVPRDPATGTMPDGIGAQTRQVLENLRAVLATAGATLDDVVAVTAYLADIADWEEFNAIYGDVFRAPYPTRTTVGAQLHGFLVEISAIARIAR